MTITNRVTLKSLNAGLTPATDVPDAPTIGTATAGVLSASVAFTAAATGGTPTSYTVTSSPGSLTGTGASSPITVSGLTGGTSYTFTVTATNSAGTSPASSASNSITPASPLGYESIATVTLASQTVDITFSSIPGTYKHLQLRFFANDPGGAVNNWIRFNGDTGSNYSMHYLEGTGSVYVGGTANTASAFLPVLGAQWGCAIIDILDYADTNKYKTERAIGGYDNNGSGYMDFGSATWRSTSAITSITLTSRFSGWAQYTHAALYGIKV